MSKQHKQNAETPGVSRETNNTIDNMNQNEMNEAFIKDNEEPTNHIHEGIKEVVMTNWEKEKKRAERKPNTIYTLKSFRDHINKLATYKVCTAEEIIELRKIHKAATERWIGLTMEE